MWFMLAFSGHVRHRAGQSAQIVADMERAHHEEAAEAGRSLVDTMRRHLETAIAHLERKGGGAQDLSRCPAVCTISYSHRIDFLCWRRSVHPASPKFVRVKMARGDGEPSAPVSPVVLRERAAQARRLVHGVSRASDRQKLSDIAAELEEMADQMERGRRVANGASFSR